MALFSEYAVTPDVYNQNCYESSTVCDMHVRELQKTFLSEGIVRDLRNSEWQKFFSISTIPWHPKIRDFLKNLAIQGRLVPSAPALPYTPKNDREWCEEALKSKPSLNGIIVSDVIRKTYRTNSLVESVSRLSSSNCRWWSPGDGSSTIRLRRNIDVYKEALILILRHATSIMFIDPHINNPKKDNYTHFIQLLKAMGKRTPNPIVEIHCKIPLSSNPKKDQTSQEDLMNQIKEKMKTRFREEFESVLENLKIEIFVWDNFHDRYLISNLGGVLLPHGFDTSEDESKTTWLRIPRKNTKNPDDVQTLDNVQLEFARESKKHKLHFTFKLS